MKWYLSGFPKAGLHLLDALLKPITQDGEAEFQGTYMYGSWGFDRAPLELLTHKLSYLPDNHRLLGHARYDEDLDLFLYHAGIAHVFIYRDLRDVAVSQAHHILSDDDVNFRHPAKDLYRALGSFEDVLAAVWHGVDGYPGVEERWRHYWLWLSLGHRLAFEYANLLDNLEEAAGRILQYGLQRAFEMTGLEYSYDDGLIDKMATSAHDTSASPTFRRGVPGEWRDYRHVFERGVETA